MPPSVRIGPGAINKLQAGDQIAFERTGDLLRILGTSAQDFSVLTAALAGKASKAWTVLTPTTTGAVNDWTPGLDGHTVAFWNGGADFTPSGIAGGATGNLFLLKNITAAKVVYVPHNTGPTDGNKTQNLVTSGPTPIAAGGWVLYQRDATDWKLVGHEQGASITPTFNAAHYTSDVGTWGVDVSDRLAGAFRLAGRFLTYAFDLSTTTVTGSPSLLQIGNGAYGGFTLAVNAINPIASAYDGGGPYVGAYAHGTAGAALFKCLKPAAVLWVNAPNGVYVQTVVTLEVS